jgi:monoamine oxidase
MVEAAGHSAYVLEANARCGGRTLTHALADGSIVDLGGAWLGPGHLHLKRLGEEFGLSRFASYHDGDNVFDTGISCSRFTGSIPWSLQTSRQAVVSALERLDDLAVQVDVDEPWRSTSVLEMDGTTFGEWLADTVHDAEARAVLRLFCEAVLAVDPAEVSLFHVAFYAQASGGFRDLVGIEGGAQDERFLEGAQELSVRLAASLSAPVCYGCTVRHVGWSSSRVTVGSHSDAVSARAAIIAVPPAAAARITYAPRLPIQRQTLIESVLPASAVKCLAVYESAFWRAAGLSGHGRSLEGPVKGFFDVSPPSGRPGVMLGFVEGAQAIAFRQLPSRLRREIALRCIGRLFGQDALEPVDYLEHDFSGDEHIGGCYAGYFPPGVWTRFGAQIRGSVGPLHWAGTETAGAWYGYMEGAVRSGERAAENVLAALA